MKLTWCDQQQLQPCHQQQVQVQPRHNGFICLPIFVKLAHAHFDHGLVIHCQLLPAHHRQHPRHPPITPVLLHSPLHLFCSFLPPHVCRRHRQFPRRDAHRLWDAEEIKRWVKATMRLAKDAVSQELAANSNRQRCLQVRGNVILQRWGAARPFIPPSLHNGLHEILLEAPS